MTKPIVKGPLDGNAFSVLGAVQRALKEAGTPKAKIDEYVDRATSGDYKNLLAVSAEFVDFDL